MSMIFTSFLLWATIIFNQNGRYFADILSKTGQQDSKSTEPMKRSNILLTKAVWPMKRSSDGLLSDLFQLTVDQKVERIKLRKKVGKTDRKLDDLLKKVELLEKNNKVDDLKKKVDKLEKENNARVAFTVRSNGGTIGAKSIIPFNQIIINAGNGFNMSDSIFYCPRQGLYLFSASVESYTARTDTSIIKNGIRIGWSVKGSSSNLYGSSAFTVISHLVKGDKLWVRTENKASLGGITFFTGIRISK